MDTSASQMIQLYLPVNNSFAYLLRTLGFFCALALLCAISLDEPSIMLLCQHVVECF